MLRENLTFRQGDSLKPCTSIGKRQFKQRVAVLGDQIEDNQTRGIRLQDALVWLYPVQPLLQPSEGLYDAVLDHHNFTVERVLSGVRLEGFYNVGELTGDLLTIAGIQAHYSLSFMQLASDTVVFVLNQNGTANPLYYLLGAFSRLREHGIDGRKIGKAVRKSISCGRVQSCTPQIGPVPVRRPDLFQRNVESRRNSLFHGSLANSRACFTA